MVKFTPLKFQGTLAAAGVALMPYIFLKINLLKNKEEIFISDLVMLSGSPVEYVTGLFLTAVMGLFILIHFSLTVIFLKELILWLLKGHEFTEVLENPLANSSLFSPLISLPMSMIVFFGPVSFFAPILTAHMQNLIPPACAVFISLWVLLMLLEAKVTTVAIAKGIEYEKVNFGWLLDVLAFGAISLLGSSITVASKNNIISSSVAIITSISLLVGITIFIIKLSVLFYHKIKLKTNPSDNILPAYFLTIPPMCLLGFSLYRMLGYGGKTYSLNTGFISSFTMIFSYLTAIAFFFSIIFVLRKYLKEKFISIEYSPAQWGIV